MDILYSVCGDDIDIFTEYAISQAKKIGERVECNFDGFKFTVASDTEVSSVIKNYDNYQKMAS